MAIGARHGERRRLTGRTPRHRRSPKGPRLVRLGEAALGRRHAAARAAPRDSPGLGAVAHRAWPRRKSGRTLRIAAPAALVVLRDARRVPLVARPVHLLRRLPRLGAVDLGSGPMAALHPRLTRRNHHLTRRAPAHARRQAVADAAAVRVELPVFRSGAVLHEDAWPVTGRRQHHDARALSGTARGRRHGRGLAEVRGRCRTFARLESPSCKCSTTRS